LLDRLVVVFPGALLAATRHLGPPLHAASLQRRAVRELDAVAQRERPSQSISRRLPLGREARLDAYPVLRRAQQRVVDVDRDEQRGIVVDLPGDERAE